MANLAFFHQADWVLQIIAFFGRSTGSVKIYGYKSTRGVETPWLLLLIKSPVPAMLLGRLELFAVLVLFIPSFWRE